MSELNIGDQESPFMPTFLSEERRALLPVQFPPVDSLVERFGVGEVLKKLNWHREEAWCVAQSAKLYQHVVDHAIKETFKQIKEGSTVIVSPVDLNKQIAIVSFDEQAEEDDVRYADQFQGVVQYIDFGSDGVHKMKVSNDRQEYVALMISDKHPFPYSLQIVDESEN